MPLLETKDLGIQFGGLRALDDVYLTVDEREIIGLIGPNGAGKTTVFNLLTGVYAPTKGAIRFCGKSIIGKKPYQINRLGIARTFQNIRLFKHMSVLDNIKVAMNQNMHYTVIESMFRLPRYWKEEARVTEKAKELLRISKWRIPPTRWRRICRTASSASWRSCVRLHRNRKSCCSTSRPPA